MAALKHRHDLPSHFRHSMAMGLLEAGIATEVIALFLGHETPKTTHLYMEAEFDDHATGIGEAVSAEGKEVHSSPMNHFSAFLEPVDYVSSPVVS